MSDSQVFPFISEWQQKAIAVAKAVVQHRRDDYKEFIELCLLYLNDDDRQVKFRRPGAVHKARWMAKILYAIKMVLLEQQLSQLEKGTVTNPSQQQKLRSFVTFVCLIYSRWWITCTSVVDAPWHDLCLYQDLLKYKQLHPVISASAIAAWNHHLWYLCSEMIPVALFSDIVPKPDLQRLAKQLLVARSSDDESIPKDLYGTGFEKPSFSHSIVDSTQLSDLVTSDSWFLFRLLKMDADFLSCDISSRQSHPSFFHVSRRLNL